MLGKFAASSTEGLAACGVAVALLGAALGGALAAGDAAARASGVDGALLGSTDAGVLAAAEGATAFADVAALLAGDGALLGSADALLGAAGEGATVARSLGDGLHDLGGAGLGDGGFSNNFDHLTVGVGFILV